MINDARAVAVKDGRTIEWYKTASGRYVVTDESVGNPEHYRKYYDDYIESVGDYLRRLGSIAEL